MFKRLSGHSLVCLWVFLTGLMLGTVSLAVPALAIDYTVDPGQPVSVTNYHSLEDLRAAVQSGAGWQSNDSITLAATDSSLTTAFDFNGKNVTFNGNGFAASPQTAGSCQFAVSNPAGGGSLTFNSVNLSGFKSGNLGGGAIYANSDVIISGGASTFLNNQTTGSGGAIYANSDATLIARDGDLLFYGNRDNTGAAGEKANALYTHNSGGNNTLTLAAVGGKSIYFYDPATSRSGANLTIAINNGANYTGAVVFDGSRYPGATPADIADRTSALHGDTTVYGGAMALRGGVTYGAANNVGSFTLNGGAKLLSDANANKVQADSIRLLNGSVLAFDLSQALPTTHASPTTNLTLDAATTLDVNPAALLINIEAFSGDGIAKTYTLVEAAGISPINKSLYQTRGELIANTRAAGKLTLGGAGNTLQLTSTVANGVVAWLMPHLRVNNVWNASSANWNTATSGLGASNKFLHGDAVYFFGGATIGVSTVQIQDGRETAPSSGVYQGWGVQVMSRADQTAAIYPAMTVDGGEWTFVGGAIDSTDGQVMELEGGAVVAFGNETIAGTDTGSRAMHQHVRVPGGETATLKAADGATLNFTGMRALAAAPENGYGGAIFVGNAGSLTLGAPGSTGAINFTGNTAANGGGAIYSDGPLIISGGANSFINNRTSGSLGGAIFVNNNASLIANGGDITFKGNTANNLPSALYMANSGGGKTLTLAARAGDSILFHDPIASDSTRRDLTIAINQGAGNTGTVLFDRYQSDVYGNTTLYNGTLQLTGGAWYGTDNTAGSFIIESITDGAGILVDAGAFNSNAVKAQTIGLQDGAKISADMTGAVPVGQAGATVNLVLDGGIAMVDGDKLIVDALHGGALNGRYKIIDNPQLFDFNEANVTGLFDGQTEFVKPNPRYGDMKYALGPGQVDLAVTGADMARTATWTNGAGDGKWNMASRNWDLSDNPDPSLQGWFKAEDNALFAGAGQGEVSVDVGGAAPKNMTVSSGVYIFKDGPINGVNLSLTGGATIVANHFNFSQAMAVGEGADLSLTARGNLSPDSVGPDSAFTLQNGGRLLVEPMDTAHTLRSGKIAFEQGSIVGLAHFGYGPVLTAGKYTALTLEAPQISNQSEIPETSGEFIIGAYRYKYKNLVWNGNNLVMDVYDSDSSPTPEPDPALSGAPALTGNSHIAALNPVFTMLNNRVGGVFHELAAKSGGLVEIKGVQETREASLVKGNTAPAAGEVAYRNSDQPNRFWFSPSYAHTDQSSGGGSAGYDLDTPNLALGFERLIGNSAFLGLAVSVSWPEYDGGGAKIDAANFTLAAYGGGILPWGNLELNAHFGYGWTDYDQTRRVEDARYDSDYDGEMFFVGAGLGRTFWLNPTCRGVWLRPGAAYDYIHTSVDSFDEGAGEFALRMGDYDMDIHRLKTGLEAGYEFDSGFWVLGEAYYLGVYGDREAKATGYFVGDPVNGFDVVGNGLDENNLGLSAKVGLPIGPNWELNAGYDYLVSKNSMTHQGSANITFRF